MRKRINITLPEETLELMDRVTEHGDRSRFPFQPAPPTGKRVAIIGAGAAASAAAYRLRQYGHDVAMYDQLPVSGGMMFTGYPNFRLPLAVLPFRKSQIFRYGA